MTKEYVEYIDPVTSSIITALTPPAVIQRLIAEVHRVRGTDKRPAYEEAMAASLNHLITGLDLKPGTDIRVPTLG